MFLSSFYNCAVFIVLATLRRAADGIFYVDMSTMDEATKAVQIYNGLKLGENTITLTAITRQQMHLGVDKKVESVCTRILFFNLAIKSEMKYVTLYRIHCFYLKNLYFKLCQ